MQAPLLFVRGGWIDPGVNLGSAGYGGLYWSSVSLNSGGAYALYFNSGLILPSNYVSARSGGYSVRCVALGEVLLE